MTADDVSAWLRHVRGRKLESVLGECYVRDRQLTDASPLFLWLGFEGTGLKRVLGFCGEYVRVDDEAPMPKDMGDCGCTVIRDLRDLRPFSPCMDSILNDAALLGALGNAESAGIRLRFSTGSDVVILNWGDEFWVDTALPPGGEAELTVIPVTGS